MVQTVLGVFADRYDADEAVDELQRMGYDPQNISLVVKDGEYVEPVRGTKGGAAVSGAFSGATTGGVLGGLAGLLIGLGVIAIPGVGPLLIGGPIAVALGLTGAAAATISGATTGIVAGGLVGALARLGVPEEEAHRYEQRVREGAVLLAVPVHSTQDVRIIRDIFEDCNADQLQTLRTSW